MATVRDYLNNAKWVKRVDEFFKSFDMNKNGYLSREDWLICINNLLKAFPDCQAEIDELRAVAIEFTTAVGLTEGVQIDKKKFQELCTAMSLAEVGRKDRGEITVAETMGNAIFDFLDQNHDGSISWEEYKVWMEASSFDEEVALTNFKYLDKNKSGGIDRKEYSDANVKFWCMMYDPETQGMFGDKFE